MAKLLDTWIEGKYGLTVFQFPFKYLNRLYCLIIGKLFEYHLLVGGYQLVPIASAVHPKLDAVFRGLLGCLGVQQEWLESGRAIHVLRVGKPKLAEAIDGIKEVALSAGIGAIYNA